MKSESETNSIFNGLVVCHWQGAGVGHRDGADVRVGIRTERGAVAAKQLALGKELRMHFEADDHFVFIDGRHGGKGTE